MMYWIVVLCVLAAMFRQQVDACGPADHVGNAIRNVKLTLTDVTKYINAFKFDYEMELINMKINRTINFFNKADNISDPDGARFKRKIVEIGEERPDVKACNKQLGDGHGKAIFDHFNEIGECVENKFDYLEPVEKKFTDFLNDRKSCLLHRNTASAAICNIRSSWRECHDNSSHSASHIPYICDYDNYISRQRDLENEASVLRKSAVDDTLLCFQETENKFFRTIYRVSREALRCLRRFE